MITEETIILKRTPYKLNDSHLWAHYNHMNNTSRQYSKLGADGHKTI
jgi:hypothetical protein